MGPPPTDQGTCVVLPRRESLLDEPGARPGPGKAACSSSSTVNETVNVRRGWMSSGTRH